MRIYENCEKVEFNVLKGKVLTKIENKNNKELWFYTSDNEIYLMYHEQDYSESVFIEDICGDLNDLIDSPILMAEEITNVDEEPLSDHEYRWTWTFYKLATIKGSVTIRWFGTSNGYYSESVDFVRIDIDNTENL